MNKKIVITSVVVATLVIAGVALQGQLTNDSEVGQVSNSSSSLIDDTAKKLGATDKSQAYYQVIGAKDGAKYDLDGHTVEIYEYKSASEADDGLETLNNSDAEVRRAGNVVFVFHGYEKNDPRVDVLMKEV